MKIKVEFELDADKHILEFNEWIGTRPRWLKANKMERKSVGIEMKIKDRLKCLFKEHRYSWLGIPTTKCSRCGKKKPKLQHKGLGEQK